MAKCRLWVYNAENFFVASGHPFAPVIRPTKRNSKKVFFGTPYCISPVGWDWIYKSQTAPAPRAPQSGANNCAPERGKIGKFLVVQTQEKDIHCNTLSNTYNLNWILKETF